MFHDIPAAVAARMRYLEAVDARDRTDGTPHRERLRQIPPETGRFLALLAAGAPPGQVLEIGTSAGYSSLWLGLACRQRGDSLVTFEYDAQKADRARETISAAGLEHLIKLVQEDALRRIQDYPDIAFCFLDAEKDVYQDCYELVVPHLASGGILVADNMTSHAEEMRPFISAALEDPRLDALVVPIGKGLLYGRKLSGGLKS